VGQTRWLKGAGGFVITASALLATTLLLIVAPAYLDGPLPEPPPALGPPTTLAALFPGGVPPCDPDACRWPGPRSVVEWVPRILHRGRPLYPEEAQQAGVHGTVVIDALVRQDGRLVSACVSSGDPVLAQASLLALPQWRWSAFPTGQRARFCSIFELTFRFQFQDGEPDSPRPPA